MNLKLRGPFVIFWGVWHAARLFLLIWGGYFGHFQGLTVEVYLAAAILYTSFLPVEIWGAVLKNKPGEEIVRTLSQTNQYIAIKGGRLGKSVASVSGATDGALVCMIVSTLHWLPAVVLGGGVAWWLMPHYAVRADVG